MHSLSELDLTISVFTQIYTSVVGDCTYICKKVGTLSIEKEFFCVCGLLNWLPLHYSRHGKMGSQSAK